MRSRETSFAPSLYRVSTDTLICVMAKFTFTYLFCVNGFVKGPPGAPDRPLTGLDRIVRVNKSFSEVTVVWSIPDTNNAHISSYEVTVFPPISLPASGVIAGDSPLFQSRQLTLTLQHGQQYNITVRAKSCDDTVEGGVSPFLRVNVQG